MSKCLNSTVTRRKSTHFLQLLLGYACSTSCIYIIESVYIIGLDIMVYFWINSLHLRSCFWINYYQRGMLFVVVRLLLAVISRDYFSLIIGLWNGSENIFFGLLSMLILIPKGCFWPSMILCAKSPLFEFILIFKWNKLLRYKLP